MIRMKVGGFMNKKIRMITIIIAIFIIFNIFSVNISSAALGSQISPDFMIEGGGGSGSSSSSSSSSMSTTIDPDKYKPDSPTTDDASELFSKAGVILGAIRNISAIVAVITLMIIGLKYMFGSVEQKANYKATMMPYIIGCVLAVAGTTLVTFIYNAVYDL